MNELFTVKCHDSQWYSLWVSTTDTYNVWLLCSVRTRTSCLIINEWFPTAPEAYVTLSMSLPHSVWLFYSVHTRSSCLTINGCFPTAQGPCVAVSVSLPHSVWLKYSVPAREFCLNWLSVRVTLNESCSLSVTVTQLNESCSAQIMSHNKWVISYSASHFSWVTVTLNDSFSWVTVTLNSVTLNESCSTQIMSHNKWVMSYSARAMCHSECASQNMNHIIECIDCMYWLSVYMCCSVLQRVAACCSIWIVSCSVLTVCTDYQCMCAAVCCSVLQCVAVYCIIWIMS